MTPEEFRNRLNNINQQLDRIRQQLIRCQPPDTQFVPFLQGVVETLKEAGNQQKEAVADKSVQKTLKSIRSRAIRVKILLDSAANLYGSVGRWPRTELSYDPNGCFVPAEFGGHISVQA